MATLTKKKSSYQANTTVKDSLVTEASNCKGHYYHKFDASVDLAIRLGS